MGGDRVGKYARGPHKLRLLTSRGGLSDRNTWTLLAANKRSGQWQLWASILGRDGKAVNTVSSSHVDFPVSLAVKNRSMATIGHSVIAITDTRSRLTTYRISLLDSGVRLIFVSVYKYVNICSLMKYTLTLHLWFICCCFIFSYMIFLCHIVFPIQALIVLYVSCFVSWLCQQAGKNKYHL